MGVLYGLGSAFSWGAGDFLVALSARRAGEAKTFFFVQLLGLALAAALVAWQGGPAPAQGAAAALAGLGLLYATSTLLLYRAMAIGKVTVVSPLASAYAVVSSVLTWISGGRPGPAVVVGVVALAAGVTLLSQTPSKAPDGGDLATAGSPDAPARSARAALRGVPEALGAAALFGVYFWAFEVPARSVGPAWSLLVTRVSTTLVAAALPAARRGRPFLPLPRAAAVMLGAALLDNLAFTLFHHGIRASRTDIVVPLSSQFAAVTVILGCVYMRERPTRLQWLGVAVVLFGVLLVSL